MSCRSDICNREKLFAPFFCEYTHETKINQPTDMFMIGSLQPLLVQIHPRHAGSLWVSIVLWDVVAGVAFLLSLNKNLGSATAAIILD